jgi:hypothetical protein
MANVPGICFIQSKSLWQQFYARGWFWNSGPIPIVLGDGDVTDLLLNLKLFSLAKWGVNYGLCHHINFEVTSMFENDAGTTVVQLSDIH